MPQPKTDSPKAFKHSLGPAAIAHLGAALCEADGEFDRALFESQALANLEPLELKARLNHIIEALSTALPSEFEQALPTVLRAGRAWTRHAPGDPLGGLAAWPLIDWIAHSGLAQPRLALPGLRDLTSLFSAEFAIRPFIERHPELTLQTLHSWLPHEDDHVRRLISEGTRTRLPWGMRLRAYQNDPAPILPLLEALRDDASLYVRRSVANNLNDLSKDHPDLVVKIAERWLKEPSPGIDEPSKERQWIIRHAARGLIKKGNAPILRALGFTTEPQVQVEISLESQAIELGQSLQFHLQLTSTADRPQKLVLDYAIHHRKADGSLRPKTFKLKTLNLAPGQTLQITKKHPIKLITTRRYYTGDHAIEILLSGKSQARADFHLKIPE